MELGKLNELKAQMREELDRQLIKYLDDFPSIKTYYIIAYTPYFLDGDPCVYGISWVTTQPTDSFLEKYEKYLSEYGIIFESNYEGKLDYESDTLKSYYFRNKIIDKNICKSLIQEIDINQKMQKELRKVSDLLLFCYGDHNIICVSKDNVTMEEYKEHE